MKTKIVSIIAAGIGSLCVAFAFWMQYVAVKITLAGAGDVDGRYFWWPLCAGVVFLMVACFAFCSHRKHGHDHAA